MALHALRTFAIRRGIATLDSPRRRMRSGAIIRRFGAEETAQDMAALAATAVDDSGQAAIIRCGLTEVVCADRALIKRAADLARVVARQNRELAAPQR